MNALCTYTFELLKILSQESDGIIGSIDTQLHNWVLQNSLNTWNEDWIDDDMHCNEWIIEVSYVCENTEEKKVHGTWEI